MTILYLFGVEDLYRQITTKFLSLQTFHISMEDLVFSTGSDVFDKLLSGYEGGVITTIYGPSGVGKTTACLLATIATLKAGKKVIYIDTEGGFSSLRFKQLTENINLDLDQLFLLKPMSFSDQIKTIHRLKDLVNESIGLIVIDSISMHYRVALGNHDGVKGVNSELGLQIAHLVEITRKHNIPVLLTSQVYADFDERDNVKMVGGDIVKYGSKCILRLQKYKTMRKATIIKHRSLPEEKSMLFSIIEAGFSFIEEDPIPQ